MVAYYNENDANAAAWLRELIREGLIAKGEVDERSIADVRPGDLRGYTQCHFFAGIGGWSRALRLSGWSDDRAVWTGSCPCQPFSAAGEGRGFDDERHLWPSWFYLIEQWRPPILFGEQVSSKSALAWLDVVQADLENAGYAVGSADLCAAGVGAPHIRQRLYWVGDSRRQRAGWNSGSIPGAKAQSEGAWDSDGRYGDGPLDAGADGHMADANGRNASTQWKRRSGEYGQLAQDGSTGSLEHAESDGRQQWRTESSGRSVIGGRGESGMVDAASKQVGVSGRARESRGSGTLGDTNEQQQHGRGNLRSRGRRESSNSSFWDPCEWIECTDGKARPIEPGTFPLAHGVSGRVGLLRGYGNAIVPQVAQAFIEAYIN